MEGRVDLLPGRASTYAPTWKCQRRNVLRNCVLNTIGAKVEWKLEDTIIVVVYNIIPMGNESKFLVLSYLGGSNKLGYRFLRIIYENMLERFSFSFLVREKLLKLLGGKKSFGKIVVGFVLYSKNSGD